MLAYAFQTLNESEYANLGQEEFDNVQDLYAEILAVGTARQLKQGLHREYMIVNDNIMTKKGSMNIPQTINNKTHNNQRLNCDFDEYTEDNLFNRILKTTILWLSKSNKVKNDRKRHLQSILKRLDSVKTVNPQTIQWRSLQFRRNSETYLMLLTICRYALDEMLLTEDGNKKLKRIEVDEAMSKLYEHFILNYYHKHYPSLKVQANQIPWDTKDDVPFLPIMQSDVMIEGNDRILIIDAKMYTRILSSKMGFDKQSFKSNNLYQIYTYVNNKRHITDKRVSGVILYAMTDEEITPDNDFILSGDKYSIKTLDLNQEFSTISDQLDAIVKQYFDNLKKEK